MGVVIGNGYPYIAILIQEVYLDLKIEGGPLMGGFHGLFLVQYRVLRERWSQLSKAFNHPSGEAIWDRYTLIEEN